MPDVNTDSVPDGYPLMKLKSRFKAWVAPQQADFYALIALAGIGHEAVGLSLVEENAAPVGLVFNGTAGPLCLVLQSAGGLQLADGSVVLRAGDGCELGSAGLSLKLLQRGGLAVEGGALVLKVRGASLSQESNTLTTVVGDGVQNNPKLALKLAEGAHALRLGVQGLAVCCDAAGGLTINAEGKLTLDLDFLMGV